MPQMIMICLMSVSIGVGLAKHGQPREPHNLMVDAVSAAITFPLLWWGGYWDVLLAW